MNIFFITENGKNHMRVKRQVDIKNLSPQDRESCRPGGVCKTADFKSDKT